MTDDEALYEASRLTKLQANVLLAFTPGYGWSYVNLATRLNLTRDEVRQVGHHLRSLGIARVRPARVASEFNGSALHLNERGWQIWAALRKLKGLDQ